MEEGRRGWLVVTVSRVHSPLPAQKGRLGLQRLVDETGSGQRVSVASRAVPGQGGFSGLFLEIRSETQVLPDSSRMQSGKEASGNPNYDEFFPCVQLSKALTLNFYGPKIHIIGVILEVGILRLRAEG